MSSIHRREIQPLFRFHAFALMRSAFRSVAGRCLAGAAVIWLAGCAGSQQVTAGIAAAADAEIASHPSLYINGNTRSVLVSRDGEVHGAIWGTYHAGYNDTTIPPKAIRDRLDTAVDLTTEVVVDRRTPARMRNLVRPCGVAALQADPTSLAALDSATRNGLLEAGISDTEQRKDSLLGLYYNYLAKTAPLAQTSLPGGPSPDDMLTRLARARPIPVFGLERPESQIAMLCSDPNGTIAAINLRLAVRRHDSAEALWQFVNESYQHGRSARMLAASMWLSDTADQPGLAAQRQALFGNRNIPMAKRLSARFSQPGLHFVAVGVGHLVGEEGLIAQLQHDGWTITPLAE